jgi:hypothetical protein
MVVKAAMWVHGTIVEVENPGPWLNVNRAGWGTHFKTANSSHWFHIPFTTPVILDDVRPLLGKIFVFYKTLGDAKITNVHMYDGHKKVKSFDNLSLQGDHFANIDASNSWIISPPLTIWYGLGISVGVQFGKTGTAVPEIVFYTAGADFIKP